MSRKLSPWCKKVKKKLIDLDMTTTELAEVIGLSRGHVSAVVNGRSYSANTVKLISDELEQKHDLENFLTRQGVNHITGE